MTDVTDARLARKQKLLAACAVEAPSERAALLAARCSDDRELHVEIEGLLPHLGAPTPAAGAEIEALLADRADQRYVGKTFGPYTVQRLLGRGGFSRVFLATRSFEGQERRFALKVPLGGSFAEEAARYRLEIAILSQLRHPNLAGLIDVVAGPEDTPLLVMDYLEDAEPITVAAAGRELTVRERVHLFRKVLDALRSAHERGVIHCDLSAANVVVRRDGEPVLIDFGIAKVSWERAGTVTVGPRPLTYEYASPEQYRDEPLTVRTDIYSAGVLLYELLTGSLPHQIDRRNLEACRTAVCERDVERPSRRVLASPERAPGESRAMARQLRGDLDAILVKALERDPTRRYESVAAFLDDLAAHLELRPVAAKAPGALDRSWRWARRHPVPSATLALALVLSTGFAAFHVRRLERERARATRIADVLRDVLRGFDPASAKSNPVTARDLLDQATGRVRGQLADEPLVRGAVLETLGMAYSALGAWEPAEPLLREAVVLRNSGTASDRAESEADLGTSLYRRGVHTEAELHLREACRLLEGAGRTGDPQYAQDLSALATARKERGDYKEAAALGERAVAILERIAPRSETLLDARNELANVLTEGSGDMERSRSLHEANLRDLRAMLPPTHPWVALGLNNLAHAEAELGHFQTAAAHYTEALALQRRIYEGPHPDTALTLHNFAEMKRTAADLDGAEALSREALAMRRKVLPAEHRDLAITLN
ncbi:MAG: serine/threonine-protein kinase, partial [Thermoanaerobaculia bacterium]